MAGHPESHGPAVFSLKLPADCRNAREAGVSMWLPPGRSAWVHSLGTQRHGALEGEEEADVHGREGAALRQEHKFTACVSNTTERVCG